MHRTLCRRKPEVIRADDHGDQFVESWELDLENCPNSFFINDLVDLLTMILMSQINKILNKFSYGPDFEVELSTLSDLIFLMYGSNHFGFSLKQSSIHNILYVKIVPSVILSQTKKLTRGDIFS